MTETKYAAEVVSDIPVDKTKACWRLRHDLKKCMLESDCIKVDKRPIRECFEDQAANVPEQCRSLQYTYTQCRRSIIDMRSRFRGRKGDMG